MKRQRITAVETVMRRAVNYGAVRRHAPWSTGHAGNFASGKHIDTAIAGGFLVDAPGFNVYVITEKGRLALADIDAGKVVQLAPRKRQRRKLLQEALPL